MYNNTIVNLLQRITANGDDALLVDSITVTDNTASFLERTFLNSEGLWLSSNTTKGVNFLELCIQEYKYTVTVNTASEKDSSSNSEFAIELVGDVDSKTFEGFSDFVTGESQDFKLRPGVDLGILECIVSITNDIVQYIVHCTLNNTLYNVH